MKLCRTNSLYKILLIFQIGANIKEHDYIDGSIIIFDLYKQNMLEFMKHINLMELKKVFHILTVSTFYFYNKENILCNLRAIPSDYKNRL